MFVFKRAPRQTLSDLEKFLREVGDEPVVWLEREVKSWGEFSYAELEDLILSGRAADLIDWQGRYAKVVNEKFSPLWLAAIARASYNSTRGKITIDDSDIRVKDFLQRRGSELITQLSDESRKAVANVILHGQSEHLAPREIARQIRPLIGLNQRQAQANVNYRQKIFRQLIDNGLSVDAANQRADRSAIKYASKQHRQRAETIVHTELARAYNVGAHEGVLAAQRAGLMNHCEMIWTTSGTNRVCGRCLSLKDTVVGRTNEQGVQLPPLHPRCRCTISYREIRSTMSSIEPPQWSPRDKTKIISKEEYVQLRSFAETNGISLIGVKKFDGSAQVVHETIESLIALKNTFPAVSNDRHKLELEMSIFLSAQDYAETVRRTIKLNANAYRDVKILAVEYQKDVDEGWFVKGTDWRAIIHHEFGHVVANVYKLDPLKIACDVTGLDPKATLIYLEKTLSRYAGKFANGQEIIAEVFADISTGKPCEFSRKFYEQVLILTR